MGGAGVADDKPEPGPRLVELHATPPLIIADALIGGRLNDTELLDANARK